MVASVINFEQLVHLVGADKAVKAALSHDIVKINEVDLEGRAVIIWPESWDQDAARFRSFTVEENLFPRDQS